MREAGNAAEWVGEGCIGEEVGVQRVFLVGGRAFGEEVDYVGDLSFLIGGLGQQIDWYEVEGGIVVCSIINWVALAGDAGCLAKPVAFNATG
jgi:hypothetical protein